MCSRPAVQGEGAIESPPLALFCRQYPQAVFPEGASARYCESNERSLYESGIEIQCKCALGHVASRV
jgi:hypothetical protein